MISKTCLIRMLRACPWVSCKQLGWYQHWQATKETKLVWHWCMTRRPVQSLIVLVKGFQQTRVQCMATQQRCVCYTHAHGGSDVDTLFCKLACFMA